jgi:hypothetical protein
VSGSTAPILISLGMFAAGAALVAAGADDEPFCAGVPPHAALTSTAASPMPMARMRICASFTPG